MKTPMSINDEEWRRRVTFSFGGKVKKPEGLKALEIGQTITMTVTGKVKKLSEEVEGFDLTIEMAHVKLEDKEKGDFR